MSSYPLALIGHLREAGAARAGAPILRALVVMAQHGYLLTASGEIAGMDGASEVALADSLATGGITEALRDHLSAYTAGDEPFFCAEAHALRLNGHMGQFNFAIGLIHEDAQLYVTVNDYEFTGWLEVDGGIACYEEYVRMLPVVYAQWHPLYLYDMEGGIFPETARADALALAPQWLYAHNLFGPELVERIGRERVLSAPAWRVTPLDDGGVLVIPNGGFAGVPGDHRQAVADHLGLPYDPGYFAAYLARWRAGGQ